MLDEISRSIVIVCRGSLLHQLRQHLRLRFRAQHQPDLSRPQAVLIWFQLPSPGVNQLPGPSPDPDASARSANEVLLANPAAHPQKMLTLPENDLRGAIDRPFPFLCAAQGPNVHV